MKGHLARGGALCVQAPRACCDCGAQFQPANGMQKRCPACGKRARKAYMAKWELKHPGRKRTKK